MRHIVLAGTPAENVQSGSHGGISEGDGWRDPEPSTNADGLTMHEAEISQHRTDQRERRGLFEVALDDEDADRAQDEAAEDGSAAHDLEPVVENALLRQR